MKFKQFSLISKLKLQRCEIIQDMSIISKKGPSICSGNFWGIREERKKTITKKEITEGLFLQSSENKKDIDLKKQNNELQNDRLEGPLLISPLNVLIWQASI